VRKRPCAVCGSEHHPHPASPAESAPSADDEHEAESAHEAALASREEAERTLAAIGSRHADAVEATAGLDVDTAAEQVEQAAQEVARLRSVADREPALAATLERIETERERVRDQAREIAEALAAHRAHRKQLTAERARVQVQLTQTAANTGPHARVDAAPSHAQPSATPSHAGPHAAPPHAESDAGPHARPQMITSDGATEPEWTASGEAGAPGDAGAEAPAAGEVAVDGAAVLDAAERELRRLEASAAQEAALAQEAEGLNRDRLEQEERGRRVAARLAACRTRHEELSGDAGRLSARLDAARGDDATLSARLSRLNDEAELLREALEATQSAVTARAERDAARRAAEQAALEAGFGDVGEAEAAYRSPAERESKAELLRRLDDEHAAVSGVLADPELVAAAAEPAPDLAAIGAGRDELEAAYTRLSSALDRARARARRLEELHAELSERIEHW
ncbi:SMC family ATPase, partial [Nonomuraea fuscirosea]